MFNQGGGEIPVPGNDAFTKILLHFDGSNGSTTFTDSNAGGSAHTWAANSPAALASATKKYGSASLNCAGGYASTGYSADLALGGSDFTVDFWINSAGVAPASFYDLAGFGAVAVNSKSWSIGVNSSGVVSSSIELSTGSSFLVNGPAAGFGVFTGWHHVALIRNGVTFNVYVDGISGTSATSSLAVLNQTNFQMDVGSFIRPGTSLPFGGFIDEFRYSVGIARWTSNFTPPTGPYN